MKIPVLLFPILLLTSPVLRAATFATTADYDENAVTGNKVDTTAPASNISLTDFTALVATAFSNNLGGVIDFENAGGVPGALFPGTNPFFTASYGVDQARTLTIANPSVANPADTSGVAWNTNNNNTPISGLDYLGQASQLPCKFRFGTPLEAVGITIIYRGADRTLTPTVYFEDQTSLTLAAFTSGGAGSIAGSGLGGSGSSLTQSPDVFFGYVSPVNKITGLDLVEAANGFVRMDDLAFVAPPPVPPVISIHHLEDGGLEITFTGRLQSSENLDVWAEVTDAVSPCLVPADGPRFYRAVTP